MAFNGQQITPRQSAADGTDWDQFKYMAHSAAFIAQGEVVEDFPVPGFPGLTCIGISNCTVKAAQKEAENWGLPRGEVGEHQGKVMLYWPQVAGCEPIRLPSLDSLIRSR